MPYGSSCISSETGKPCRILRQRLALVALQARAGTPCGRSRRGALGGRVTLSGPAGRRGAWRPPKVKPERCGSRTGDQASRAPPDCTARLPQRNGPATWREGDGLNLVPTAWPGATRLQHGPYARQGAPRPGCVCGGKDSSEEHARGLCAQCDREPPRQCGKTKPRRSRPGVVGGPRLAQSPPEQCGRRGPDGILGPTSRVRHWPGWVNLALGSPSLLNVPHRQPPDPPRPLLLVFKIEHGPHDLPVGIVLATIRAGGQVQGDRERRPSLASTADHGAGRKSASQRDVGTGSRHGAT